MSTLNDNEREIRKNKAHPEIFNKLTESDHELNSLFSKWLLYNGNYQQFGIRNKLCLLDETSDNRVECYFGGEEDMTSRDKVSGVSIYYKNNDKYEFSGKWEKDKFIGKVLIESDKLTLFGEFLFKDNWYYIHPNHPIYFNYTQNGTESGLKLAERVNSEIPINKYKDDNKVSKNQDTNYKNILMPQ